MIETKLTRREAVAGLGASAALPLLSSTALASPSTSAQAKTAALLDSLAEDFLRVSPESATGLGIDTGRRAHLRYELELFTQAYQLPAAREGNLAFFEKRAPRWQQA